MTKSRRNSGNLRRKHTRTTIPGDKDAPAKFRKICEAYEALSGRAKGKTIQSKPDLYGDILDKFLKENQSLFSTLKKYKLSITFEESYTGCEKTIEGKTLVIPKGVFDGAVLKQPDIGQITISVPNENGRFSRVGILRRFKNQRRTDLL